MEKATAAESAKFRVTIAGAKERVGDAVIYGGHHEGAPVPEQGYITSVNDSYVFVRFGSAAHGVACRPDDLRWMALGGSS